MNALQAAQSLVSTALLGDPRLALANAVAWLDPLYLAAQGADDLLTLDDEEADDVQVALTVCRECFPHIYAGATQLIWQGADERALDRYLCDGINAGLVVGMQDIEHIKYGVPVEGMGLTLDDSEFEDAYPGLAAILADFEITSEAEEAEARTVARVLIESLEATQSAVYAEIAGVLSWLFALSGNTLVDLSTEAIWENEMELPDWTLPDIAFVNGMTQEALDILARAERGQHTLATDREVRTAFQRNIQAVYQVRAKPDRKQQVHGNDPYHGRLGWPERP